MRYLKGSFITVPHRSSIIGIGPGPQALFMWLCSFANTTDGSCFPSRKTLADNIGCSERALDSYLEELIEKGLVKKEPRFLENKQVSNNYFIPLGVQDMPQGVAESAPTPSQNLRTELNPLLTQSIEHTSEAELRVVSLEEKSKKGKDPLPLLRWAEEQMGHNFPIRTKQLKGLSRLFESGYTEEDIKKEWERLGNSEFWNDTGFDFMTVASEIGKSRKKVVPLKIKRYS